MTIPGASCLKKCLIVDHKKMKTHFYYKDIHPLTFSVLRFILSRLDFLQLDSVWEEETNS